MSTDMRSNNAPGRPNSAALGVAGAAGVLAVVFGVAALAGGHAVMAMAGALPILAWTGIAGGVAALAAGFVIARRPYPGGTVVLAVTGAGIAGVVLLECTGDLAGRRDLLRVVDPRGATIYALAAAIAAGLALLACAAAMWRLAPSRRAFVVAGAVSLVAGLGTTVPLAATFPRMPESRTVAPKATPPLPDSIRGEVAYRIRGTTTSVVPAGPGFVTVSDDDEVSGYDGVTGALRWRFPAGELDGVRSDRLYSTRGVRALRVTEDGRQVRFAVSAVAVTLDANTGAVLELSRAPEAAAPPPGLTLPGGGRIRRDGDNGAFHILNSRDEVIDEFSAPDRFPVLVGPGGWIVLAAVDDHRDLSVVVRWPAEHRSVEVPHLALTDRGRPVRVEAFAALGDRLMYGGNGAILALNPSTGTVVERLPSPCIGDPAVIAGLETVPGALLVHCHASFLYDGFEELVGLR
ncbi:hypothetical protein [Gordonia sp. FQ]|uniref:hypothetical protein n=1 Tax=Gordonia sp. FQ TaxID=3446634 RepID=UPI003F872026